MAIAGVSGFTKGSSLVGSAFDPIFKEFYLPAVRDLLNSKRILARRIQRQTEVVEGKYAVIALNTARNEGIGDVAEGARLPDPLKQEYRNARYNMRYGYARIKFTGPSASSSRTDRGAFLRIMDAEIRGAVRDREHEENRIFYGNGTGRLCRIVANVAGSTYSVADPGGITSTASGTQYLRVGMRVAHYDSEATTLGGNPTAWGSTNRAESITAIDHSAGTVTFSSTLGGTPANDFIYRASEISTTLTGASTARGNEPNGLEAIIDDGNPTFQDGVTGFYPTGLGEVPATVDVWRSFVLSNGGVPIPFSPDMFSQVMDGMDILGDGVVETFLTTHGIRRAYVNSLISNKRYVNTMELDGGYKTVSWDDRPVVPDKDCPRGRVYAIDWDNLWLFSETDWDWIDQDGSVLHRMPDEDAFQATLYRYRQLGTDARNRLGKIEDIIDT